MTTALGLLPYAGLLLLVLGGVRAGRTVSDAAARGSVAFGIVLLLGTEGLSAVHALTRAPVAALWLAVCGGAAWRAWRLQGPGESGPSEHDALGTTSRTATAIVALALGSTLLAALAASPNSWDGMTYHLPRVVHWMEQRSVAPYATSIDRQLWMPPLAEWLNLHVMVLGGGADRLVALPAWTAFAGCVVLAAGLARRLGAGSEGAGLAALLVATAPTAIVQATGTKTELVGAYWVLATALLAIGRRPGDVSWAGLATGLAIATKGTGGLFAAPWLVLPVAAAWRRAGVGHAVRSAVLLACFAVLPNAGIFARNVVVYGDPLGDPVTRRFLAVDAGDAPLLVSQVVTTASLHLATPWRSVNDALASTIDAFHRRVLGRSAIEMQPYLGGFRVSTSQSHEAVAPSLLLFVAGIVASLWLVLRRRTTHGALLAVWSGALVFALAIRWQPYGGRLLLPFLLPLASIAGVGLDGALRGLRGVVALVALALAAPALLRNDTRPLLPLRDGVLARQREAGYFAGREMLQEPYRRVLDDLDRDGCPLVLLATGYDTAEYPLWALSRRRGAARTFRQAFVANASAGLEEAPPAGACALVAVDRPETWRPDGPWAAARLRWREGPVALWDAPRLRDGASS